MSSPAPSPTSPDEHAIRSLIATWMAASKSGDTPTLLSLMTDDVLFLLPNKPPFGKEAFASGAMSLHGASLDGHVDILELQVHGTFAWTRNKIRITITPPNGTPTTRHAATLTLFQKSPDGRWRLHRDANLPAPEPT